MRLTERLAEVFDEGQPASGPPVCHHRNPWGGFSFRAYWLSGSSPEPTSLVGITIHHEVPLPVRIVEQLRKFPLSRRQIQICLLIAEDHSRGEIAKRMGMSKHTVVSHIRRIYEKLGLHSRAELMDELLKCEPNRMQY